MNFKQEKTNHSSLKAKNLKKMAHHLKPVVQIGKKGITQNLTDEIAKALNAHELIKVELPTKDKDQVKIEIEKLISALGGQIIMIRGNIITLFLEKDKKI